MVPPEGMASTFVAGFSKSMKHARIEGKGMARCGSGSELRLGRLILEFGKRFFVHIPLLEDGEDGFCSESGARQLAKNASRLFLISLPGLLQVFAAQIF